MFLYAITDSRQLASDVPGRTTALLRLAEQWALGGVDAIQIREKDLPASDLEALSVKVLKIVEGSSTKVFVNGRVDVAIATGAAVHLPAAGLRPSEVAKIFIAAGMPAPLISVACHCVADVKQAPAEGAAIALLAPIFGKNTGPTEETLPGLGLDVLRQVCAVAQSMRVLALGGVTAGNAWQCVQAGAAGIAGIRLFLTDEWRALKGAKMAHYE